MLVESFFCILFLFFLVGIFYIEVLNFYSDIFLIVNFVEYNVFFFVIQMKILIMILIGLIRIMSLFIIGGKGFDTVIVSFELSVYF